MDNFPVDEANDFSQFLILPSGSDFDALSTLNPPSPILTPSQLNFAWSSGEIPVLLYDDGYSDSLSEISDSATKQNSNKRDSCGTIRSTPSMKSRRRGSSVSSISWKEPGISISGSSESLTSVETMGTFGPRRRRHTLRSSQISRRSSASEFQKDPDLNFRTFVTGEPDVQSEEHSPSCDRQPRQVPSSAFYHPVVFVDAKPSKKSNVVDEPSSTGNHDESINLEEPQAVKLAKEQVEDMDDNTKTPTKATPKSSSWISSQSWGYGQYKEFYTHTNSSPSPKSAPQIEVSGHVALLHVSPLHRKSTGHHDLIADNAEDLSPSRLPRGGAQLHRRQRSAKIVPQAPPERPIAPSLSLDDHWLQEIYVQFLIDQEGFRSANPFFTFTGIIRRRPSHNNLRAPVGVSAMAQFKPITRQSFHFHDAPFETPPILRRVTVNGDDGHDYVSKQALLTLKVNGVYVLHGQEISVTGNSSDSEPVKLHWQFEYLVDDRIADTSGRVMDGEKILTPLTFSCSPGLLLPQQARKNTIMHVFKKGVAPKLAAEKLHPPMVAKSAPKHIKGHSRAKSGLEHQTSTEAPTAGFFSSKSHGWGLHRRGQSQGGRHPELSKESSPPRTPQTNHDHGSTPMDLKKPFGLNGHPGTRHLRRNSSAGEHKGSPVRHNFGTVGNITQRRESSQKFVGGQTFSPSRHILPPAQLNKLMDAPIEKENVQPVYYQLVASAAPDSNSSGFVPLTPRPRHAPTKSRDLGRM